MNLGLSLGIGQSSTPVFAPTLWVTPEAAATRVVYGYSPAQLGAGAAAPVATITLPNLPPTGSAVFNFAIDAAGALWAAYDQAGTTGQTVAKFGKSKLVTGSPTADVAIQVPSNNVRYGDLLAIAIDNAGGLWIATQHDDSTPDLIVGYSAASLLVSGTPTPAAVISSADFIGIADMCFDATGNLWVCSYAGTKIDKLTPAQLVTNAAVVPAVQLTVGTGSDGLAFDSAGNLWVTGYDASNLRQFAAASLVSTSSPAAAITITSTAMSEPCCMAFDSAGALWIASSGNNKVLGFAASALASGGAKTPATSLVVPNAPYGVRFGR